MFRPYAKHFLGPLLQLVVSGNNGGDGIHFMVVDVVVTVLSWLSVATPKVLQSPPNTQAYHKRVKNAAHSCDLFCGNDPG